MVRVDGAGTSHELIKHLLWMSSRRRILLFTCGWMITAADEDAVGKSPPAGGGPAPGRTTRPRRTRTSPRSPA
jgi:hypothetical protein